MSKYLFILVLIAGGCNMKTQNTASVDTNAKQTAVARQSLTVTSSAFQDGQPIPQKYSCDDENISPPISWSGASNAKSYAMVVEDPDAPSGMFVHWVIYNIPASEHRLAENIPAASETLPNGTTQGKNGANKTGYTGPCPPNGTHRYFFKVYALDTTLSPSGDMNHDKLVAAIQEHVMGEGQLMGTFARK
jgi:Raf kinase inhibitor-like YbhB/YbcL family protein